MKRMMVTLAVFFLIVNAAWAGTTKENCGCGIGSMAFEGKDGLVSQLAATFTNGIFGNQTFGITSGTLGCEKPYSFTQNEKLNLFVAENMDNLAVEIASGQGESLDTLAEIAEIPAENRAKFFTALQGNFDAIYPSPEVTHTEVVKHIVDIIKQI